MSEERPKQRGHNHKLDSAPIAFITKLHLNQTGAVEEPFY
jgi:hypothetical protein